VHAVAFLLGPALMNVHKEQLPNHIQREKFTQKQGYHAFGEFAILIELNEEQAISGAILDATAEPFVRPPVPVKDIAVGSNKPVRNEMKYWCGTT
jgi:hypothetical protein